MAGRRRPRAASARREQGLKKKATELATLCGVDVCIIGHGPDGELFFWPDDVREVRRVAERYLDAVGGGGGAAKGRKRKRAEEVVGNMSSSSLPGRKKKKKQTWESDSVASLGTDGAVDEAVGDGNGGGGVTVLSSPAAAGSWIRPNNDFDLLDVLNMMCSPSPVVMPDDLLEPLQMAVGGGAFPFLPVVPPPSSAAAAAPFSVFAGVDLETACTPEPLWALEDGFPSYSASLGPLGGYEMEDNVVADDGNGGGGGGGGGATAVPPVDPLLLSLAAADTWTHQKGDLDLVKGLYMMSSPSPPMVMPDDPEPLQRAYRGGASPFLTKVVVPSAAVGASSIVGGLHPETTCRPEPVWAVEDGAFPSFSASMDPLDVLLSGIDFGCWADLQEAYTGSSSYGTDYIIAGWVLLH